MAVASKQHAHTVERSWFFEGGRYECCECGATRRVTNNGSTIIGAWHACELCSRYPDSKCKKVKLNG